MDQLSEAEHKFIEQMKKNELLVEVNPYRLDQSQGIIMVTCADGDQMPDIFQRQSESCLVHRSHPRIHILSLNGGALLIPSSSPLNREFQEDRVLLHHLQTARQLKNIHVVALYVHLPCGVAGSAGLSLTAVLNLLVAAKVRLKKTFDDIKVACFCHIDYGNNYKRVYFVSRRRWLGWQQTIRNQMSLRETINS